MDRGIVGHSARSYRERRRNGIADAPASTPKDTP